MSSDAQNAAVSYGVILRSSPPVDTTLQLTEPAWSVSALHHQLFAQGSGLRDAFICAIDERAEESDCTSPGAFMTDLLETVGMTALDGQLAEQCRQHRTNAGGLRWLVENLSLLGSNTRDNLRSGLEDIFTGPLRLFEHVERTPIVAIHLPADAPFTDVRADTRRELRRLLTLLGRGCQVVLYGELDQRRAFFADAIGDEEFTITSVTGDADPRQGTQSVTTETAEAALADGLTPRKWYLLETLADAHDQFATYAQLNEDHALGLAQGSIRRYCHDIEEEFGLVVRANGTVILTRAGELAVELYRRQVGEQGMLKAFSSSSGHPPNRPDDIRVSPPPDEEGGAGPLMPNERARETGYVAVEILSPSEHHAAVSTAPAGVIGVADAAVETPESKRTPLVSVNRNRGEVVAGAHYYSAYQYLVCLARSLLHPSVQSLILDCIDDPAELGALFDANKRISRQAAQLGYLPDAVKTGEEYLDELDVELEQICQLTTAAKNADVEDRSEIVAEAMRRAHGLIATMTWILECCEIEFTRLVYLPHYARDLHTNERNTRLELFKTLSLLITRGSKCGAYNVFRTLYEERSEKRKQIAGTPTDPAGELIGGVCIAGPGAGKMVKLDAGLSLEDALEDPSVLNDDLQPQVDAPNFAPAAVDLEIRTDLERAAREEAAARMCAERNLWATDVAVSVFTGLARSTFDVTCGLAHLGEEPSRREIHLDEVRYALMMLDYDRLLPNPRGRRVPQRVIACLLAADEPLSQAEIARRAEVSTQSIRNNREVLELLALIERTDKGWVFGLPTREERGSERDASPWVQAGDRSASSRPDAYTFDHLVCELARADSEAMGPPPEICGGIATDLPALVEHSPQVQEWLVVVAGLTGVELEPMTFEGRGVDEFPLVSRLVRIGISRSEVGLSSFCSEEPSASAKAN